MLLFLCLQDAVYIELAGSHAHREAEPVPDELLALQEMRHTLDAKMRQSQMSVFKVRLKQVDISIGPKFLQLEP